MFDLFLFEHCISLYIEKKEHVRFIIKAFTNTAIKHKLLIEHIVFIII